MPDESCGIILVPDLSGEIELAIVESSNLGCSPNGIELLYYDGSWYADGSYYAGDQGVENG